MSSEEAQELTAAVDTLAHLLHEQKLTAAVEALARQVQQLALIVDEVRSEMVYAVRNPRPGDVSFWRPALSPESEEDEDEEAMPVPRPPVRPTTVTDAASRPALAPDGTAPPRTGQGKLFS